MSEVIVKTNAKGTVVSGMIKNVYAYYTRIQTPQPCFGEEGKPNPEREFVTNLVMDKEAAKVLKKHFKKTKIEEFDAEDLVKKLKLKNTSDLPYEAEEYFYVKLAQKELKKDGTPLKGGDRPHVVQDGKVITFDKLVGNGSEVSVTFTTYLNKNYGLFPYLGKMLVHNLEEYGNSPSDEADKELFGDLDFDEIENVEIEQPTKQSDDFEEAGDDTPPFEMEDEDDFE